MKSKLSLIFSLFLSVKLCAWHFIGGDLTYTCLSNGNYVFSATVYRDCGGIGPGLADNYDLDIFDLETGEEYQLDVEIVHNGIIPIDNVTDDPCVEIPPGLCLEKAVYTVTIDLPLSLNGYYINFSECCFTDAVNNVFDPTNTELSLSTIIPPVDVVSDCNGSPVFNEEPPLTICLHDDLSLNLGATWPQNPDASLVYSFYTPEDSTENIPPPYNALIWGSGYSATAAIPTVSGLNINPLTGEITGTPNQIGNYLMGVVVYAIEDGDTIGEINRVFRYTVSDCNINRSIAAFEVPPICGDLTVAFANESFGADTYEWNFGDINSPDNISTEESPIHTFSDYGTYTVSLTTTAGSDSTCSDISYLEVVLEEAAESQISVNDNDQCLSANSFNFQAISTKTNVDYLWTFGASANFSTSTEVNPEGIVFNQAGIYTITLATTFQECITYATINIEVYDGLLSDFEGPTEGCAPFTAIFEPTTFDPSFKYEWRIGTMTFNTPVVNHTFTKPDVYDVTLFVEDIDGCESVITQLEYLEIFSIPETGFDISDPYISVGELVTITNTTNEGYTVSIEIPELDVKVETNSNFVERFEKEGKYTVIQTVTNGACSETLTKYINVGPARVIPPNVFSPNNDFINDFFYINPHYNTNMELYIYNRWGKEVFASKNYELCNAATGEFCWDGKDKSGKECSEGAYAYTLILPNGFRTNGFVQLFK